MEHASYLLKTTIHSRNLQIQDVPKKSLIGDEPTWKCVCTLSGDHERPIYDIDWSHHSGLIAAAGGDDCVNVYEEDAELSTKNEPCFKLFASMKNAHAQDVNCVRWNPKDGRLLATCSDDMSIKVWKICEL